MLPSAANIKVLTHVRLLRPPHLLFLPSHQLLLPSHLLLLLWCLNRPRLGDVAAAGHSPEGNAEVAGTTAVRRAQLPPLPLLLLSLPPLLPLLLPVPLLLLPSPPPQLPPLLMLLLLHSLLNPKRPLRAVANRHSAADVAPLRGPLLLLR